MKEKISNLFLREKPVKALTYLKDKTVEWYPSLLAKRIDCTYPHIVKVLGIFKELELVNSEKKGRQTILRLTERGEELAHDFEGLMRHMEKMS